MLAFEGREDRRISVCGGPVLAADDPTYRGLQIPRDFWKVVIYRVEGQLRFKAFVLTQDISTLGVRPLDYPAEFDTHQVTLDDLTGRTGMDFQALAGAATPAPAGRQTGRRTGSPAGRGLGTGQPVRVLDAASVQW